MKRIPIIRYNDVAKTSKDEATTDIETLEYQLRYLRNKGFESISLDKIADNAEDYSPQKIALTFDGAYLGHYQYVFPLLQQYQFTATFFIPTNFIGGLSVWAKSKKTLLCFEDIFEMYQWGMDIGVNSASYADLTGLGEAELTDEIYNSKKNLEKMLTGEIKYFAYPAGKYDETVKLQVQKAGYNAAVSYFDNTQKFSYSRYALDRLEFSSHKNLFTRFELNKKTSGIYS